MYALRKLSPYLSKTFALKKSNEIKTQRKGFGGKKDQHTRASKANEGSVLAWDKSTSDKRLPPVREQGILPVPLHHQNPPGSHLSNAQVPRISIYHTPRATVNTQCGAGSGSVAERLPSTRKAIGSISSPAKIKFKKKHTLCKHQPT
jgi:hypothetical protein